MQCLKKANGWLGWVLAGLALGGCVTTGTVASRKQERVAAYEALSPEMRSAVDQGMIKTGMSMDAVYIAWGNPNQIVSGGNQAGETTTWIYQGSFLQEVRYWGGWRMHYAYSPVTYVRAQAVFTNGVVKEWQTFPQPLPY